MDHEGGCEVMLHDPLNMDLGDWHPRNSVITDAFADQKHENLEPESGWLQDILLNGILAGNDVGARHDVTFAGMRRRRAPLPSADSRA
jgi:hypothetical protein